MTDVSLLTAAAAGLVSFLSPCVLPLVPGYLSFLSGISVKDLQEGGEAVARRRVMIGCLAFVLGFSTIFILLGASATLVGQILLKQITFFQRVAGVAVIVLGIHLTGLVRLPFLNFDKHIQVKSRPLNVIGAYGVGMAFGFGWTPCIGPILAGILTLASVQETIGRGMLLLAVYSAGLGIPFLLTGAAVGAALKLFGRFKKHLRWVEIASGALLILVGLAMVTGRLSVLAGSLPFLNRFAL